MTKILLNVVGLLTYMVLQHWRRYIITPNILIFKLSPGMRKLYSGKQKEFFKE